MPNSSSDAQAGGRTTGHRVSGNTIGHAGSKIDDARNHTETLKKSQLCVSLLGKEGDAGPLFEKWKNLYT